MEYILKPKDKGCLFCNIEIENNSKRRKNLVLYTNSAVFVIMNRFPYTTGHLMITPIRHESHLEHLKDKEYQSLFSLVRLSLKILKRKFKPDGFNIGMNLGKVAGAGVEEHLHFHLVPRWNGDTSFMPVLGETNIMPQHLLATYDLLLPLFQEIKACDLLLE
jgi:ATP adenylyltransferase